MVLLKNTFIAMLVGAISTATASGYSDPNPSSSDYCVPHKVSEREQRKIYADFVQEFYVKRNVPKAFHKYIAVDYIQHNPNVSAQGAAASEKFVGPIFGNPALNFTVQRMGFDNGLGWLHTRLDGLGPLPTAVADIYRFNGSCIQEHWDVIQTLFAGSPNPIALF